MQFEASRFPEWKTLYDAAVPLIEGGRKDFDYDELSDLGKVDIRSDRGRWMFYRFRRELLKNHQLWMENVAGVGYSVVPVKDQPLSAYKRVKSARRKVVIANAINTNIRFEELSPEQRLVQAATAAVLHDLSKSFHAAGRKLAAASEQAKKLPVDIKQLMDSISRPA